MDNKCLEYRLLTRESTVGGSVGSSVSRCAAKFNSLTNSKRAADEKRDDNVSGSLDSFIREVYMYRLDIGKTQHMLDSYSQEMESYHSLEKEIAEKINSTRTTIQQLETELDQERQIRAHREELEEKAKAVNQLPTRAHLKRKIDAVTENMQSLSEAAASVDARLAQRQRQFSSLLQCIADLQNKLIEEEEATAAQGGEGANEDDDVENDREDGGDGRASTRYNDQEVVPTKEGSVDAEGDGETGEGGDGDGEGEAGEGETLDETATQATNEGTLNDAASDSSAVDEADASGVVKMDEEQPISGTESTDAAAVVEALEAEQ
jgi:predicted  nucleic acid-binding Zn-ribbon protein